MSASPTVECSPKKVLYVLIGLAHFPYHESVIASLCDLGIHVDLVVLKMGTKESVVSVVAADTPVNELLMSFREFASAHANFRLLNVEKEEIFAPDVPKILRFLRSYASYVRRLPPDNFYRKRWLRYMPESLVRLCRRSWAQILLKSSFFQTVLGWMDARLGPNKFVLRKVSQLNPDLVIVSPGNMRYSHEVEWLKAARKRGKKTAIMTVSWDNLTTKGLIHIRPDYLFVWNRWHAREAKEVHFIPGETLFATGAPFFDKWRHPEPLQESREIFLPKIGLDPKRPYVVYLGSSANIADNEAWLVRQLFEELRLSNGSAKIVQIYIRPHPGNKKICADLSDLPVVLSPDEDAGVPFSFDRKKRLYNLIAHAAVTVGLNTSAMIDAIAIGKPCISIRTDRYNDTHLNAAHFKHLENAVVMANDTKDCVRLIEEHLLGQDLSKEARELFLNNYIKSPQLDEDAGVAVSKICAFSMNGSISKDSLSAYQPFISKKEGGAARD